MTDAFGTYTDEVNVLGDLFEQDDFWDAQVREPALKEGNYSFMIVSFEKKENPIKGSVGFTFKFRALNDEYGNPLELSKPFEVDHYFYIGNNSSGTLIASPYGSAFQDFLKSIDVTPAKLPELKSGGKWMFNNASVQGLVVKVTVYWEKVLSNRENPETGLTPTELDVNDPSTYNVWAKLKNIRGFRDESGKVKKVFI